MLRLFYLYSLKLQACFLSYQELTCGPKKYVQKRNLLKINELKNQPNKSCLFKITISEKIRFAPKSYVYWLMEQGIISQKK